MSIRFIQAVSCGLLQPEDLTQAKFIEALDKVIPFVRRAMADMIVTGPSKYAHIAQWVLKELEKEGKYDPRTGRRIDPGSSIASGAVPEGNNEMDAAAGE
jgi:hypothetical protein